MAYRRTYMHAILEPASHWMLKLESPLVEPEHFLLAMLSEHQLEGELLREVGCSEAALIHYIQNKKDTTDFVGGLSDRARRYLLIARHIAAANRQAGVYTDYVLQAFLWDPDDSLRRLFEALQLDIGRLYALLEEQQKRLDPPRSEEGAGVDELWPWEIHDKGLARSEEVSPGLEGGDPAKEQSDQAERPTLMGIPIYRADEIAQLQKDAQKKAGEAGRKKKKKNPLEQFAVNLNRRAKLHKIDPVIGREQEVERLIQILARRTKNNPVLIGEPGVGKTAIVEGLAQKIVQGDVPAFMKDKTIYALEMNSMVAGTKYRGDFEARMQAILQYLKERSDIIIFMDELHTMIGAGSAEGALDASNILKPALSRGEIQVIGATTREEYRKRVEKEAALERRFQPIAVEEPSAEETLQVLQGLRAQYESFHHVRLEDEVLQAAVRLTARYLPDRYFPDKAIDVLDEAMAKIRVRAMEEDVLRTYDEDLAALQNKQNERVDKQDYAEAKRLKEEREELEKKREKLIREREDRTTWPAIQVEDLEYIVSAWAHVPITQLTESENERYHKLPQRLKKEVIGQDDAIDVISRALQRARVGLNDPNRPIGAFLFVGPTGVGKTYLAKRLAADLFGGEEHLIRFDMSEYMESIAVSRLIGAAPGYVGYEEGGQLTEAVRAHPYSVVLFDEIEKAHADVYNVLLQMMDEGRLTDGQGRTIDCRNTIIILTSNAGSSHQEAGAHLGFGRAQDREEYHQAQVQEALKAIFRPEFLNRLDASVIFHPLDENSLRKIIRLRLQVSADRMKEKGIHIEYTDAVVSKLIAQLDSTAYGARPLDRLVRTEVEDPMVERILQKNFDASRTYRIFVQKGVICVEEKEENA